MKTTTMLRQSSRLLWMKPQPFQIRHTPSWTKPLTIRRQASTLTQRFGENWKKAQRDNPVLLPVLLVGSIASVSVLALLLYDDYTRVSPQFSAYPAPVEQQLRFALHAIHVDPDPVEAEYRFTEALRVAEQCQMDPFSKEVMGIRIRLAEMLEKFGHMKSAVEVLNGIIKSCEDKLTDTEPSELRTALIRGSIQARVKAASLYESDYLQDLSKAKQTLSDAVGLLVKETRDPQAGFSEDNAAGISLSEIAAMLSQMGDLYATTGEEANAVQVYMLTLQPLRAACDGSKSCMEVQVLSNIAATMDIALKKPEAKINGRPATKESRAAARKAILKWADQAIATANAVKLDERDETCELSRLSAEMTKADILLEDNQKPQAKEAFRNLLPMLKERGLDNLVAVAEKGIQRANA